MTQLVLTAPPKREGVYTVGPRLSAKLARTLAALRRAGAAGLTTMELARESESCGVAQDVFHLRNHNYKISCTPEGTSKRGARISRWRLVEGG